MAMPGNTAATFLVRFSGTGLADDRNVVERIGELVFDRAKRRVTLTRRPLRFTAADFQLLHALSLGADEVTNYETLMRQRNCRRTHSNFAR